MKTKIRFLGLLIFLFCASLLFAQNSTGKIGDFSFLHITDSHLSPYFEMPSDLTKERSYSFISKIKDINETIIEPYNITAPKPDFIIHTGDISEFSFPGIVWELFDKYFEGYTSPIYLQYGNHDMTWVADTQKLRNKFGGVNYSFNHKGCHFIGLCTATIQEPVPTISEEIITFVKNDLKNLDTSTPVIIFFHHPLFVDEFCSKYDTDRLLDILRPYNVILMLDGHGHAVVKHNISGIDGVEGGSTYSHKKDFNEGGNIVYIKNNILYVAYRANDASAPVIPLIKKTISTKSDYPVITIKSVQDNEIIKGSSIKIEAEISKTPIPISKAYCIIDGDDKYDLTFSNDIASGEIDVHNLCNGSHWLKICFEYNKDEFYHKSIVFNIESKDKPDMAKELWKFKMQGASKAAPLIYKNTVYIGSNDGFFYAIDKQSSKLLWRFNAGAEILTTAVIKKGNIFNKDKILFGSGNGIFYALSNKGKIIWQYNAESAIYSSPVIDEKGIVYFGTNKGAFIALNIKNGKLIWKNNDAKFAIESKPYITKDRVYFGSWDGYLFCLNKNDGKLIWKTAGPKNQSRVITYYAPADNRPVVFGDKIFIADRGYVAGYYNFDGKYITDISDDCSAISLSQDNKSLYLRTLKKPLKKIDTEGKTIWEANDVIAGRLPISPTEADGYVYTCTNSGRLFMVDAARGQVKKQYQVTPKLFVMSEICVDNRIAYISTMDGYLKAIDFRDLNK